MRQLRYWTTHPRRKNDPMWAEIFELDAVAYRAFWNRVFGMNLTEAKRVPSGM